MFHIAVILPTERVAMAVALEGTCVFQGSLDAARCEAFTQREFSALISEAHGRGRDYYIARAHFASENKGKENKGIESGYVCYDARQLCKHIFEMVISTEGRRIRIKNFTDPVSQREMKEVNFFRLRYDSDTPLRAEFVGNHVTFLESGSFRNRLFYHEDATEALSINFQFKSTEKLKYVQRRSIVDVLLVIIMLLLLGLVSFIGVKYGKRHVGKKDLYTFKKQIKEKL